MKSTTGAVPFNLAWLVIVILVSVASVGLLTTPYYLYAILPGLCLFFSLFLGKFPQIGYYTIVFVIPFGAFRGSLPWVVAAVLTLLTLFRFLYEKQISPRLKSRLWPLLLCFIMVNVITSVKSEFSEYALSNVMFLAVGYTFVALGMIFLSKNDFENYLPKTLVISMSISSFLAVFGALFHVQAFVFTGVEDTELRATGGSIDANNMSLMVIYCIPLTVHWLLITRRPLERVFVFFLILAQVGAIVSTYSRGGSIIFAFTLLLLIVVHSKKLKPTHWGFAIFVLAVTIFTAIYFTPSDYWDRLKSVSDTADTAMARRKSYITVASGAVKRHPITGSGTGTFRDIYATTDYARMYTGQLETTLRRYAHNTYIEHVVGSGILGLCLFIAIIGMTLKSFQSAYKKFTLSANVKMAELVRAYQISFISLLCYFFFISDIQHKYFLMSVTLAQVALRLSGELSENEKG